MPRLLLVGLLALSGLLTGCARATHTLDPADAVAVRGDLDGHSGTVILVDGGRFRAQALRVEADTTSWFGASRGEILVVSTSAIAEVERYDRDRAAGRSAQAGAFVAGLAVGVALGVAGYDAAGCILFCDPNPTPQQRVSGAATFGLAGAMTGAASGALVGAIGGAVANLPDRYILAPGYGAPGDDAIEAAGAER